jgi:hypothetical protein
VTLRDRPTAGEQRDDEQEGYKVAKRSKSDEPADTWVWHEQPNSTFPWTQISLPDGLVPDDLAEDQRYKVFTARFKSSSPDCELFIHDPVKSLVDGGIIKAGNYRVTTHVLNHQRTLSKWHLFATATIAKGTIGLTLYKVAPPKSEK